MELPVLSSGEKKSTIVVSDDSFSRRFNEPLVHQVVTAYFAKGRQGTKAQKNRGACRGGGAKPWRQKGTGRARAGTSRSPIWRGGGVTFAAEPRDYSKKVNRKAYRAALASVVSELVRQDRLRVVDEFHISAPKTKELLQQLAPLSLGRVLLVVEERDGNLELAARNVHYIDISTVEELSIVALVAKDHVVFTVKALKQLEENLS